MKANILRLKGVISKTYCSWGSQGRNIEVDWSGEGFPSPVDHVLSELSTMTRLFRVVLQGMAHRFIELQKMRSQNNRAVWVNCTLGGRLCVMTISFPLVPGYRLQWVKLSTQRGWLYSVTLNLWISLTSKLRKFKSNLLAQFSQFK